jgi:hypothetical protein
VSPRLRGRHATSPPAVVISTSSAPAKFEHPALPDLAPPRIRVSIRYRSSLAIPDGAQDNPPSAERHIPDALCFGYSGLPRVQGCRRNDHKLDVTRAGLTSPMRWSGLRADPQDWHG